MNPSSETSEPKIKKKLTKQFLDKFGDDVFVLAQNRFLKMTPEKVESVGARLGRLHYAIDSKHRNRTFSNLKLVYPDWSEEKIKSSGKAVFEHFGRTTGDFLRTPVRTNQEVLDSVVEVEGIEHRQQAEACGVGTLLITSHFGNWERLLQWLIATGSKMNVIARDADQEGVQKRVLQIREKTGANVISTGNSARQILTYLRKNEIVGMLADQNSSDAVAPFFGIPAGTALGPAVMHIRTQAALLPCYCVRVSPCQYKIKFMPLVDPENLEEDRVAIMTQLNSRVESGIREYPEQWLWMHDRWKYARRNGLLDDRMPVKN